MYMQIYVHFTQHTIQLFQFLKNKNYTTEQILGESKIFWFKLTTKLL